MPFRNSLAAALGLAALTAGFALADSQLGKPFTLSHPQAVHEVLDRAPDSIGKSVQVKGVVTEVCQMMGCWMAIADVADPARMIRIQVADGDIVFPKDSVGKLAIAEGTLVKLELTRVEASAQAKHEAEEQGRKFDPKSITHGVTIYEIHGTGALISTR